MSTVVAQYDPKIGCWSTRHGVDHVFISVGPLWSLKKDLTLGLGHTYHHSCNLQIMQLKWTIGQSYWIFTHLHFGFHLISWCCNCWSIVCIPQELHGRDLPEVRVHGGFPWVLPPGVHSGSRFGKDFSTSGELNYRLRQEIWVFGLILRWFSRSCCYGEPR